MQISVAERWLFKISMRLEGVHYPSITEIPLRQVVDVMIIAGYVELDDNQNVVETGVSKSV